MPSKWIVVDEDGTKSVKVSAYENIPNGRFKIQPVYSWAYKIVFCPIYGDSCGDLGISKDVDGKRRFGLVQDSCRDLRISRSHDGIMRLVITDDNPLIAIFIRDQSSDARRASVI
ncbi:kunitz-type serine protease inhibitor DrTI-like [Prosopis cineraria]|uniref:kunitz-type serine protease inhibitor DrTI-like n=1 Tax=Prosopis cineraria TaxID=364024 RepID=UPI00240FFAFA|nr:kunitz-type serine protease inhibitor DrTI-like [Prosopis cineraria]